jgi:1,4-alpha-glucan branching enzyme
MSNPCQNPINLSPTRLLHSEWSDMLHPKDVASICNASHHDPFSVLGPHGAAAKRRSVRCFLPGAAKVTVLDTRGVPLGVLTLQHVDGFFEGMVNLGQSDPYTLHVNWASGLEDTVIEDPYRFGPVLGELDVWLLGEGTHLRPFEVLGAQPVQHGRCRRHAIRRLGAECLPRQRGRRVQPLGWPPPPDAAAPGVWRVGALPARRAGRRPLQIRDSRAAGQVLPQRADPYALQSELRPATASVVAALPPVVPTRCAATRCQRARCTR